MLSLLVAEGYLNIYYGLLESYRKTGNHGLQLPYMLPEALNLINIKG